VLVLGLVGAFIIANPALVFSHLGPEAYVVGSKLKKAIDIGGFFRVRSGAFD
jgi:hypothetical protein